MLTRILHLDDGIMAQESLRQRAADIVDLQSWGPRIRIACSFPRYRRFQSELMQKLGSWTRERPELIFYGSGDFHHVSLALLRRIEGPFNLLMLDKHPDWMRAIPVLHGGTWLYQALQMPNLQQVFHLGGELDFDNWFRWLAPWQALRSGRLTVFPAVRRFERSKWKLVPNEPLRSAPDEPVTPERLEQLLGPRIADLARHPLYITLDKDVMRADDAVVNWDSGFLTWEEIQTVLQWFWQACHGNLAGMDVLGDWSPVRMQGVFRWLLHATEHPRQCIDAEAAQRINAATNQALLETVSSLSQGAAANCGVVDPLSRHG